MKKHRSLLALAATVAWLPVQGATIISDDFSSYANDTELTAVWSRATGTSADIGLSTNPEDGADATIAEGTTAGRLRQTITPYDPTDDAPLVFSFNFYDSNPATSGRAYGEIRNSAAATGLFAAGLFNSANTGTYAVGRYQARNLDNGGWIQLDTVRTEGWHTFTFEIKNSTVSLYVDGAVDPQFSGLSYSGTVLYDWVHLGSGLSSVTPVHFDDVLVTTTPVPEPSTAALALAGLAGLGCLRRRRS